MVLQKNSYGFHLDIIIQANQDFHLSTPKIKYSDLVDHTSINALFLK